MAGFKQGGNPPVDMKESKERYQTFVKPVLEAKDFQKIKGNSHTMVSHSSKTIIIPRSAPSNTKHKREMRELIKGFKKQYVGYNVYVFFHRDKQEWIDKPSYMATLRSIMNIKSLNGVICGIDNFAKSLNDICGNQLIYKI
jgi:hypothetical protein